MSSAYEGQGRVNQKQRTRQALVRAAEGLLSLGITPTIEQAAERAGVSRPTAYRYFSNQHALLIAAHPPLAVDSLLPEPPPTDPFERLEAASRVLVRTLLEQETALRAMLRISLEERQETRAPLALRTGRRIRWIENALAPLHNTLEPDRYRRLVLQISATLGIEPLIWLIDIAHVERNEAGEILRASASDILRGVLSKP
jgi:AcrR family transcriptional regulator